ncbi:CxxxxCH/CxxCH domain c-type cytochrome [Geomesophilobacter sediminis]|uniref:CxxxxCH/CxxCH domain-containing protein n=1 Tax=Geomesophilobacter sediminis TaxID=2798584 RepID=A0A8J7JDS0_9BACT|nr:CxxxxCH/CxxCH domain-containing protein [Geomesophilobacter sediminis]MBJ6725378.1 CxxxxCH/CxxCH domain-containing protein [Geomesophilobacter sediminis]
MSRSSFVARMAAGALLAVLAGCATQNDQAPPLSDTGQHSKTWVVDHRAAYVANPDLCRSCHGADLRGGISKVDCFNQGNLPGCHANGHGPRVPNHPIPFKDPALHGPVAKADLTNCQTCHATAGGAGSNPRFNLAIGSLPAGCEQSGCHNLANPAFPARSSAHPRPWRTHNGAGNLQNACTLCHGGSSLGGTAAGGVGPACNGCHTLLAAGNVPTRNHCDSCHAFPPASGSHSAHLAVGSFTCDACHSGGGTGTLAHYNHTDTTPILAVYTSYNAKSGAGQILANGTCSNIRCHGGITTPAWGVGQINVATDCTTCHVDDTAAATQTQYNSFHSGRHDLHVNQLGLACTVCHDMTVTAGGNSHFSNLKTSAFELPAAATIKPFIQYGQAGPNSCSPGTGVPPGTSLGCHPVRTWQ